MISSVDIFPLEGFPFNFLSIFILTTDVLIRLSIAVLSVFFLKNTFNGDFHFSLRAHWSELPLKLFVSGPILLPKECIFFLDMQRNDIAILLTASNGVTIACVFIQCLLS